MTLVPRSSPPSSGLHPRWPVLVLALPFLDSILGSWTWFNTDLGRGIGDRSLEIGDSPQVLHANSELPSPISHLPSPISRASAPRILLTARTNLAGYTFIAEPVSDSVKETLGTTNIESGTFYRIEEGNRKTESQKSEATSVL